MRGHVGLASAGLVATASFWAVNAIIGRAMVGEIPPLGLAFWRWVLAFSILAPFGVPAVYRQWPVVRARWKALVVIATFSVGLFNTLLYIAAQTTTALNIAMMNATLPIAVAFGAHFALREYLNLQRSMGIALGFLGILVIITEASLTRLLTLQFVPGDLVMLSAVASWTLFSVVMRWATVPLTPIAFLTVQIAFGIPIVAPFYIGESMLSGAYLPRVEHLWVFAVVAIGPSLLAYAFWNNGVKVIGASRAALFLYLIPVVAAVLGYLLLDERLAVFHAIGGVLILLGLTLAVREQNAGWSGQQ